MTFKGTNRAAVTAHSVCGVE